ncbi:MAG: N4-gp56 family major capsid protein [Verrucomicrobiota bacterium]
METTTNPASVANRQQRYFDRMLLEHAVNELRLSEFAMKRDLPRKMGTLDMRFFRRQVADESNVVTLTEGTPPNQYVENDMEHVDVTLAQLGEVTKLSDIRSEIDIFNALDQNIELMAEDAALKCDSIVRNAILSGMLNSDNVHERFGAITPTGDSSADFTTLDPAAAASHQITRARALGNLTALKVAKAPRYNGNYICILPPQLEHDMRQDSTIEAAWTRSDVKKLYADELGVVDGIRYVSATNPFIESNTYGTYNAAGDIFAALFFGKNAFGCPKLKGTSSPHKPSVIINDKPDKSDPLNQFIVAGWKALYAGVLLNSAFCTVHRFKSTWQG